MKTQNQTMPSLFNTYPPTSDDISEIFEADMVREFPAIFCTQPDERELVIDNQ